jgi:hypothetical protein
MIGVLSKEKELAYVEDAKKFKDLANKAYDEHDYT